MTEQEELPPAAYEWEQYQKQKTDSITRITQYHPEEIAEKLKERDEIHDKSQLGLVTGSVKELNRRQDIAKLIKDFQEETKSWGKKGTDFYEGYKEALRELLEEVQNQ